jgi:diguanylate cyclase (GGDEF)-like protein
MVSKSDIEALIDLTGRHNKYELMACLVENVRKIAGSSTIAVYEVFNTLEDRASGAKSGGILVSNTSHSVWCGEPVEQHEGFAECIASQQIVRLSRQQPLSTRLVFPIRGTRDLIGLLAIDCNGANAESLYMIEALSHVWRSQQFLLDRSEQDALTGLLNRQALETRMPYLFGDSAKRLQRSPDVPLSKCLAMLDLDKFKEVNDKFGHLFGDEVLVHFARLMTRSFRPYDEMFRYGGEEFVVILHNVKMENALAILERFRQAVESYDYPQVGKKTVSIGVIQIVAGQMPTTLLDRADKALYYAKQNGRNRTCAYEDLVTSGQLQESEPSSGDVELF